MLKWVTKCDSNILAAIQGEELGAESVQDNPHKIPESCLDENVNIARLKKYFNNEAWTVILKVIDKKKEDPEEFWPCISCECQLGIGNDVTC